MKLRNCKHCGVEFDSMQFSKGPPRRYCSAQCRGRHSRGETGEPNALRQLQGRIGMAERYGRTEEAQRLRAEWRELKNRLTYE